MIVECIGNKANGMAELRRLLQKQFNSNSQERSPSYNSLTSHAVTSVLSLMSLEFVFRPPDHDPDIKATLVPLPCPFPLYLIFLRSRTWMLSTDVGTAPWRSSAADHRRWLKS